MICLNCGRMVEAKDIRCRYCGGSFFVEKSPLRKPSGTHRGGGRREVLQQRSQRNNKTIPVLVVSVLGLVVFLLVAIPNLLRSRLEGGYGPGMGALRAINEAAAIYANTYGHGFPSTLAALGAPKTRFLHATPQPSETAAGLISKEVASGAVPGWRITYVPGPPDRTGRIQTYTVRADPINPDPSWNIHYFTDQTGVIRQASEREAGQGDSPIAG